MRMRIIRIIFDIRIRKNKYFNIRFRIRIRKTIYLYIRIRQKKNINGKIRMHKSIEYFLNASNSDTDDDSVSLSYTNFFSWIQ